MNAILGSGILGLAYAGKYNFWGNTCERRNIFAIFFLVKSLGIVLYIAMLMVVAGLAFYAITLLLDMCELTGFKVRTINTHPCLTFFRWITTLILVL